ncbi:MAG TPA: N-acetyl-gamma-glutamyl-phosphate reductase [Balneolales bacterium]|nr:N-acetyl-gamma-glutamyl-phosphate reductase [Balneolales bacterium]
METYNVGIIGGTGYTGSELIRLLLHHPNIKLKTITSESQAGTPVTEAHPHLHGLIDDDFQSMEDVKLDALDVLFLALPHGVSMDYIKEKRPHEKCIVIDLSGDFRLLSAAHYDAWYPKKHVIPELVAQTVFGMPELYRDKIKGEQLIANPGCYPTSSILPLAPILKEKVVHPDTITIDAKSGVTGAGAKPKPKTHYPTANENFSAYGLKNHRHTPEIQDALTLFTGTETRVLFTPHLLPVNRGILSTIYSKPIKKISTDDLNKIYNKYYGEETFIRLRQNPPELRDVRGTNYCDIYVTYDDRTDTVITVSCIDNLVKGAAGQAVQNMNIRLSLPESTGLTHIPLTP